MLLLSRSAASFVIAALLLVSSAFAQGIQRPQDTSNAIASYEVLGVRLGMTEADAIAAIKQRFPAGSKNTDGRPVNLKMSDYELSSPRTLAKVRAGVRFDLHPEQKSNFSFIKLFVHEGKVWAIWRDDMGSRYPYDATVADLQAKYRGAAVIPSTFVVVTGNTIAPQPGPAAIDGLQLYQGPQCIAPPFARSGNGDKISLDPGCNRAFHLSYQPRLENGVKVLASGHAQLVDLEAGRSFMRWMASGAGDIQGNKPRTGDAKL